MGNSGSLAGTAIKVAAVAGAAALAWACASQNDSDSPPPPEGPPETEAEKKTYSRIPEDYRSRRDPPEDYRSRRDPEPVQIIQEVVYYRIPSSGPKPKPRNQGIIKIMSYNVWYIPFYKKRERMEATGKLIMQHSPDIILLQEMSHEMYKYFESCNWWDLYSCSVRPEKATVRCFCMLLSKIPVKRFFYKHFDKTASPKGISVADIETESNKKLVIATCHLKKPDPPNMYVTERVSQAKEAIKLLGSSSNVVLGGDMNWDEDSDGPFPLLSRWKDAWSLLRPNENGYTYDTVSNGMLTHSRSLQKRLDRFICKLNDFRMIGIEMIGTEAIPWVFHKSKGETIPVLPSDHYGLILTICPK